jgi:hypothetical protein
MALADIVGGIATLCSISSFVPQAWKIIRTRDTSGISTRMYVLTVVGFSLWLTYGILLGSAAADGGEWRVPGAVGLHPGDEDAAEAKEGGGGRDARRRARA